MFMVPESQLYVTKRGQGGKLQVDFIPDDAGMRQLRYGDVPLRFVRLDKLDFMQWRTLHLAINCHFDPLPDPHCAHNARVARDARYARNRIGF